MNLEAMRKEQADDETLTVNFLQLSGLGETSSFTTEFYVETEIYWRKASCNSSYRKVGGGSFDHGSWHVRRLFDAKKTRNESACPSHGRRSLQT